MTDNTTNQPTEQPQAQQPEPQVATTSTQPPQQPPAQQPPTEPEQKSGGSSIWTWIAIIALVIIGAGAIWYIFFKPAPPATPVPTAAPPAVELPTPAPDTPYAVVGSEAVNVRSGPSTAYPIYGIAQPGQSAPIIGKSEDGGWWQISINPAYAPNGVAWVSAQYTEAHNADNVPVVPAPELPPEISPPPSEGTQIRTTDVVNIRSGPGSSYESYGVVTVGTVLTWTGESQENNGIPWLQVVLPTDISPDGTGWVSSSYVEPVE